MKQRIIATALFALFAFLPAASLAQDLNPSTPLCGGSPCFTASNPGTITGSFSATLSGFTPGGTFATLTATGTAGTVALPAGTVVAFQNTGTTTVSCTVNTGSAAVANEIQVPASSTVFITVGANTSGSCIDQTGSTSNLVVLAGGSGLGTGFGGGGGGGSSGAVFGPTAVGSAAANPPVLMGGTANGTATGNVAVAEIIAGNTATTTAPAVVVADPNVLAAVNAGVGTPGSAPPANVIYWGANASGATGGLIQGVKQCDQHKLYDASTNGSTLLVTGVSGRKIYICGFLFGTGATATNVKLVEGTTVTTPCDTSTAAVTPAYQLAANAQTGGLGSVWNGLATATAADNLCINTSAGNAVQADVWFTIQ